MEVQFTPQADHDIWVIYDYIARDSLYYADLVTDQIVSCAENLISMMPRCGQLKKESPETREYLWPYDYTIRYTIRDKIYILRVYKFFKPSI